MLEDIQRRYDALAKIIDPICERSVSRSEHNVWPEEIRAIVAAVGSRLPPNWGDVDEQLGRILTAAKRSEARGADLQKCVAQLREGLARLRHVVGFRRRFADFDQT